MRNAWCTVMASALVMTMLVGCPRSSSNNDNNDNLNDTDEFTTQRQEAVRLVMNQLVAAAKAYGTLNPLTDSRLSLSGTGFSQFGTCPQVTSVSGGGNSAVMQFEYGKAGCTAAATGTTVVAGTLDVTVATGEGQTRVDFDRVTIDGVDVAGFFQAPNFDTTADGIGMRGSTEVETDGIGTFEGNSVFIGLNAAGQLVMAGNNIRASDGSDAYEVDLDALVIDPVSYTSFVPSDGELSFVGPGLVRIRVLFSVRAAEDEIVRVIVGNGSAINFNIQPSES